MSESLKPLFLENLTLFHMLRRFDCAQNFEMMETSHMDRTSSLFVYKRALTLPLAQASSR